MSCAFRIHGNFVWPPHPKTITEETRKGVVEIHFVDKGEATSTGPARPLKAWLHWIPDTVESAKDANGEVATPGDGPDDNVYLNKDLFTWFGDGLDERKIWLFAPDTIEPVGEKLNFRGGFLLDQPPLGNVGQDDLRLPLVPTCSYHNTGKATYSEVIAGQPGSDSFRLNLLIPTPFAQTTQTESDKTIPNPSVFAFSALYRNSSEFLEKTQDIYVLVCGPGIPGFGSFQVHDKLYPKPARLGAFGFSAHGEARPDFVVYSGTALKNYWPTSLAPIVRDVFSGLGIAIKGNDFATFPTGLGDLSIRFGGTIENPKVIYRIVLQAPAGTGNAGDLAWAGGTFRLRLRDALGGGWIDTGSDRLVLELTTVHDTRANPNAEGNYPRRIGVDLSWTQALSVVADMPGSKERGDYTAGLLQAACWGFAATLNSLRGLEGALPQSFVPQWTIARATRARFVIRSPLLPVRASKGGERAWGYRGLRGERRPPLRLGLAGDGMGAPATVVPLDVQLPGFFAGAGSPLKWQLQADEPWLYRDGGADWSDDAEFASFRIAPAAGPLPVVVPAPIKRSGRLSSLRFRASEGAILQPDDDRNLNIVRIGAPLGGDLSRAGWLGDRSQPLAVLRLRLHLGFDDIDPVTVDIDRRDRSGRSAPLLIAVDRTEKSPAAAAYYLDVRESLLSGRDRLMKADLYENDQAQDDDTVSYVVLSEQPFSLSRFAMKRLGDRGDAGNQLVATYSSDERVWNVRQVADDYHYSLPPQSAGESMDKPRRLEIHDIADDDADSALPVRRPFVSRQDMTDDAAAALGDLQRRAVEFRLTPSAELWIRPSDVERGYFPPEWTGYDIFRQRGALGLGAALSGLRAEFLYGLSIGIDPVLEKGTAHNARVAEVEALIGRIAGPFDSEEPYAQRWASLSNAIARRPERLEIWANDPYSPVAFAPARFRDGVSFSLRSTALHRAPVGALEKTRAHLAKPKSASLIANDTHPALPRYHPQGLSGGALWPVESANLFRALIERPEATGGGSIEGIALSPQGGDATQKAFFLNGLVSIISKTEGGFVSRLQVEVIGRISCCLHRAKHVVVYERTVSPSPQFQPTREDDPDGTRTRRPVLRKVREYVELLQQERRYPDFEQPGTRQNGFMQSIRFNSRIINVDSAWSREIGEDAWEIPLWNRQSARERPQVYGMPDICLVSTAQGDGEAPVVAQACEDPDLVYFFSEFKSSATDKGIDTDQWPLHYGIDACHLDPAKIAELVETAPAEPHVDGARRRNASRFLPGFRRFTWRLGPAGQKTAINAGRSSKPVYAGLESITFMRGTSTGVLDGKQTEVLKSKANVAALKTTVGEGLAYWCGEDGRGGPEGSGALSKILADLRAVISHPDPDAGQQKTRVEALRQQVEDLWNGAAGGVNLPESLLQSLAPALHGIGDLDDAVSGFTKILADNLPVDSQICTSLGSDSISMIRRKQLLILENLRSFEAEAQRSLQTFKDRLKGRIEKLKPSTPTFEFSKADLVDCLALELCAALGPVFDEASNDIGRLGEGIEKARAIASGVEAEANAVLKRARMRVDETAKSWDRDKPWSASRLRAFEADMRTAASGVYEDMHAAVDEARDRLAIELGGMERAVGSQLARALAAVIAEQKADLERLCSYRPFVTRFCKAFHDAGTLLLKKQDGLLFVIRQKTTQARQAIANADIADDLKPIASALLDRADAIANDLEAHCHDAMLLLAAMESNSALAADRIVSELQTLISESAKTGSDISSALSALSDDLGGAGDIAAGILSELLAGTKEALGGPLGEMNEWAKTAVPPLDALVDPLVRDTAAQMDAMLATMSAKLGAAIASIAPVANDIARQFSQASEVLKPSVLRDKLLREMVLGPVCETLLKDLEDFEITVDLGDIQNSLPAIRAQVDHCETLLSGLADHVGEALKGLTLKAEDGLADAKEYCELLTNGPGKLTDYIGGLKADGVGYLKGRIESLQSTLDAAVKDYLGGDIGTQAPLLLAAVGRFDQGLRSVQNDLANVHENARAYADRIVDHIASMGTKDVPNKLLRLYSAVTTAPELAALKCDIDRIRATFNDVDDIIRTTRADALFDKMGDELRALGITLPFDGISDRLLPVDLTSFDISKVFGNLGGVKFDSLFKGYKIPKELDDAIRITHDFDRKQALAWVNVEIDVPLPERKSLFSLEVFSADFVDTRLTGRLRLEASKDTDTVSQTGFGRIETNLDLSVSGQSMVMFQKLGINFTRESGLEVEFDPNNIRLNPAFKFIQDLLADLFPDEIGGVQVLKRDGIPVGIEHEFSMPPIDINFGTSGVQNIQITNRFQLIAYPDFRISNRFNLSRAEAPFIFSIFVIGGAGYVQIDADYRPFDSQLAVSVEAAAGGSASFALAVGPFVGTVYMALSIALSYRKVIDDSGGGGLSVAAVLVIAGNVRVCGIVNVNIVLMLRMAYRDSGQIDAEGTLSVSIRISRFFKINARANITYTLRDGRSQTQTSSSADLEITDPKLAAAVTNAKAVAEKIKQARG